MNKGKPRSTKVFATLLTTSPAGYEEFLNEVPTLITYDQNRSLTSWAS